MTGRLLGDDYIGIPETVSNINRALDNGTPYSFVRLGDGENMVLAQEAIYSLDWISKNCGWSHSTNYCGVSLPNLAFRDRMVEALKKADLIGVFAGDSLTEQAFDIYGVKPKAICYAFDNLYMPMYKPFVELLRKNPPLLVGNPAEAFAAFLQKELGITAAGTVSIKGSMELDQCIDTMARVPHQWSLVSAGCNAVIIASEMASRYGKVSIDFGHAPDNVMSPDYLDYWLETD